MFIPWGTVSMPKAEDRRQMGVYLSRKVAYLDQRWGWPALPSTQPKFMSALQKVEMEGIAPRQQYNIYPFSSVTYDRIDQETRYKVGADMFWRPSTNFQMNATLNPDFGAVESDDVVINLSATETFFPEKRLFFLEGQEIFVATPRADTRSSGGVGRTGDPTTMVNTRRIGGRPEYPSTEDGVIIPDRELIRPVELDGAVKFTGQLGNFRYGILGAFEKEVEFDTVDTSLEPVRLKQDGSDYGIARLLYQTNAGGAYKALGVLSTLASHYDRDAMAHGIDGHYLSKNGSLKIDGQAFTSDIDGVERGYGGFVDFEYTFRQGVKQRLGIQYYDEHIDINDLGFLSRNDSISIRTAHTRTTSDLRWARDNQFDVRGSVQQNNDGYFTGGGIFFANQTTFDNLTQVVLRANWFPKRYDDLNSFGNGIYRVDPKVSTGIRFNSDTTKAISYSLAIVYNSEDLGGDSFQYNASIDWRPTDRFNASAALTYYDREGWLLHQNDRNMTTFDADQYQPNVSVEYFVSAKQQFRISFQWVGIKAYEQEFFTIPDTPGSLIPGPKPPGELSDSFSISDMVVQARYRWEIAPLSDIFIVYTRASDTSAALRGDDFDDLLSRAWTEPIGDQLIFKIRYRFGS
jgi:hypothetical protein